MSDLSELEYPCLSDEDRENIRGIIDCIDNGDDPDADDAEWLIGLVNDLGVSNERRIANREALWNLIPKEDRIMCCEGGGPEDRDGSVAMSVARLIYTREHAIRERDDAVAAMGKLTADPAAAAKEAGDE